MGQKGFMRKLPLPVLACLCILPPPSLFHASRHLSCLFFLIVADLLMAYSHIIHLFKVFRGFPGGSDGKESACQCRRPRFDPWVRKIPLEEEMAAHCNILACRIPWTEGPGGL